MELDLFCRCGSDNTKEYVNGDTELGKMYYWICLDCAKLKTYVYIGDVKYTVSYPKEVE